MVEVFKTNVESGDQATMLILHIHMAFPAYKANFDLDDCDHILRVASTREKINASLIIKLLDTYGFSAQVLEDEPPVWPFVWTNELSFNPLG